MKSFLSLSAVAMLVCTLPGCCFFYPEYAGCANPPNPSSFEVHFFNRKTEGCANEGFPRAWKVEYTDFEGQPAVVKGKPISPGLFDSIEVHDAADDDNDGFIDEVTVRIYVGCNPEAPENEPLGWSSSTLENSLPVNATEVFTLEANGLIKHETLPLRQVGFEEALSAVNRLTGTKIAPEKPAPAKKKSCCW